MRNRAPAVAAGGAPLSRQERRSAVAEGEGGEGEHESVVVISLAPKLSSSPTPPTTSAVKAGTEWTCLRKCFF
jgi:hypothetical protein